MQRNAADLKQICGYSNKWTVSRHAGSRPSQPPGRAAWRLPDARAASLPPAGTQAGISAFESEMNFNEPAINFISAFEPAIIKLTSS